MMSVAKLGGNLVYYLKLATLDYYHEGGEPAGQWFGRGASRLNLSGDIDPEAIRLLATGFSADGQRKLVQNAGKENRQTGWDCTFSAPKSVSVLWSMAPLEVRHQIQESQRIAVESVISYLEEKCGASRVGKKGERQTPAGLVVGLFEHGSSRANDPQLHTHALILNIGVDEENKTRTILSKPIYQQKMTAGALYRAELGHQLVKRLGLRLEKSGFAFKVKGVPESLCDFHSKRRKKVLAALRAAGQSSSRAAQIATLDTRSQKDTLPRAELFQKWQSEAAEHSFTESHVPKLLNRSPVEQRPAMAAHTAFEDLISRHSYFTESELLRETAIQSQADGVSMKRVQQATNHLISRGGELLRLSSSYLTSKSNMKMEESVIQAAARLNKTDGHRVPTELLESTLLSEAGRSLSWEQSAAVAHITIGTQSIALIDGKAGTGKTRMLGSAVEVWGKAGYRVLGACVAGKASRGLHEATGIETTTVAKLLYDAFPAEARHAFQTESRTAQTSHPTNSTTPGDRVLLDAKTVLVLDEAAMIGTNDMARIFSEAERNRAKVVLIGDARQLQPIAPGNPFDSLAKRLGAIRLDEIQRQTDGFDRQLVYEISEGNAHEAIESLNDRGLVHVADSRLDALNQLVADWRDFPDASSLILVPSRAEVSIVNEKCQKLRQRQGLVKNGIGLDVDGQTIQVGDRIQFGRRSRSLNIENGDFATVESLNRRQNNLVVRMDDGRKTLLPIKDYDSIKLGYATTVHKGQGVTVERAFVLLEHSENWMLQTA